jgi:hypothetical protein
MLLKNQADYTAGNVTIAKYVFASFSQLCIPEKSGTLNA